MGEISNYGQSKSFSVIDIPECEWILELEDIEKDSGRLIQRLTKNQRNISGTRHRFEKGEVLYSKLRTYLNKAFVASEGGYCSSEIVPIRCYGIEPKYLLSVLRSKYYLDYTASLGYGVKMPRLGTNDALVSYIPMPPLNEQKRIIVEIEKWNTILDTIEKHKFDLLCTIKSIKSRILDLALSGKLVPQDPDDEPAIELLKRINPDFKPCDSSHYPNLPKGWSLARIKDVFTINPRNKANDEATAGFISMNMIDDEYSNTFTFEKRKWQDIKTGFTHFQNGDIAVAKISPCLENRKSIIIQGLPNRIGAGTTELHVFRSTIVNPKYALYFFKTDYFIDSCVRTFNGVVGQQRVGKNVVEEIVIPTPPIKEQQRIVTMLETIFSQLNTITAEL